MAGLRYFTLFLSALFLSTCTSSFTDDQIVAVHPSFYGHYESFISDANRYGLDFSGDNIVVSFRDHPESAARVNLRDDNIHHITFDRTYYAEHGQDTAAMKAILYHELGHVFLNLDHVESCISIMNPTTTCMIWQFRRREKQMINRLFQSIE